MKKLTVNEQEELFAQDCKLINLRYEYSGFTGTEKWAIITELSEEALWDKYPDVISRYTPFILLSMAQGEVISESHKLYEMTSLADCPFVLWVGNRRMIKRRIFDEYIEQMYSI